MLVVDFAQFQSAIDHMARFTGDVTTCLENVDQTMAALRAAWHGEASDAQAQSQQQWDDAAEQMKASLSQLQTIAAAARRNYAEAVDKNTRMWG